MFFFFGENSGHDFESHVCFRFQGTGCPLLKISLAMSPLAKGHTRFLAPKDDKHIAILHSAEGIPFIEEL